MSETEVHALITNTTNETVDLQNPVGLLQVIKDREENFCNIQNEIKSLYKECQKDNLCPFYKEVAKDMINHITDGRFEEFYRGKPSFLGKVDADFKETVKHVNRARKELEDSKSIKVTGKIQLDACVLNLNSVKKEIQSDRVLHSTSNTLEKFESNFGLTTSRVNDCKRSIRDEQFEDHLRELIHNIKSIQKVTEARKTIDNQNSLYNKSNFASSSSSIHTDNISKLLTDIERLNYTDGTK